MFGEPAQRPALSNGHIRWIIQGEWQAGGLQDGVSRWQGRHVTGWSGCQWRIRGNGCFVCVSVCVCVFVCVAKGETHEACLVRIWDTEQRRESVFVRFRSRHKERNTHTAEGLTCRVFRVHLHISLSPSHERSLENCNRFHGIFSPAQTMASRLSVCCCGHTFPLSINQ